MYSRCTFFSGWTGADCTDDVDECADDSTCSSNGNCTNLQGSYSCDCDSAYTGEKWNERFFYSLKTHFSSDMRRVAFIITSNKHRILLLSK